MQEIGEFTIYSSNVDAKCILFDGHYGNNNFKVKIRKVLKDKFGLNDIEKFQNLSHPNIQKIFSYEELNDSFYLIMENFEISLRKFIEIPKKKRVKIPIENILKDAATGLDYLHGKGIIHKNICPNNVHIICMQKQKIVKLFNCGLDDINSEEFKGSDYSKESDIFSLGKVFFYVLSNGNYDDRWIKISKDKFKSYCANDLRIRMMSSDADDRIKTKNVLENPFFWDMCKIFTFLTETNRKMIFFEENDARQIENFCKNVVNNTNNEDYQKSLNGSTSVIKLLKFIIKYIKFYEENHYKYFPDERHLKFWLEKFPLLLSSLCEAMNKFSPTIKSTFDAAKYYAKNSKVLHIINENESLKKFIIDPSDVKCTAKEIGKGAFGKVYEGKFNEKSVAIKKMSEIDFSELKNLSKSQDNDNDNIVKFYGYYCKEDFHYLIFEHAEMDLNKYLKNNQLEKIQKDQILFNIISGICHIHNLKIMHLDLKPENILIANRGGKKIACICDFGKSWNLNEPQVTFTNKMFGTKHWQAPEIKIAYHERNGHPRKSKIKTHVTSKADIYSYGLIFYYVLRGEKLGTTSNTTIIKNINKDKEINETCRYLLVEMLKEQSSDRVDADAVQKHPYFWSGEKLLIFLREPYNFLTENPKIKKEKEKSAFNTIFSNVSWINMICDERIAQEIENYNSSNVKEKLSGSSFHDLLKIILLLADRKSSDNFPQAREITKATDSDTYPFYWLNKFDQLLPFCYYKLKKELKTVCSQYYSVNAPNIKILKRRNTIESEIPSNRLRLRGENWQNLVNNNTMRLS